jgi:hypothetical protein
MRPLGASDREEAALSERSYRGGKGWIELQMRLLICNEKPLWPWPAALSRADPVLGTARDGSPALRGRGAIIGHEEFRGA